MPSFFLSVNRELDDVVGATAGVFDWQFICSSRVYGIGIVASTELTMTPALGRR
jgi:hypothetical protein